MHVTSLASLRLRARAFPYSPGGTLPENGKYFACRQAAIELFLNDDCFYYGSERINVVVLFETLKVQSFILTEVNDCGLLIVVTSSTFLKRKDM